MSARSRPETAVPRVLWLGGLLVVLGGLFGMHGLDNHGGASISNVAHTTVSGLALDAGQTGHGLRAETAAHRAGPATAVVAAAVSDASEHLGMDMSMAGMCMAVLVLLLGLFALLLRIRASRLSPPLWRLALPARAPGVRGRDPDPPSLVKLSIQRC